MKLKELFDHLAFSELAQLNGIDSNTGLIEEKSYDKVLSAINLGLTALHSRFCLKEEELLLPLESGKYSYKVGGDNSLIKVERIYANDEYELPLNDDSQKYSIHTPNLHTLVVHKEIVEGGLDVPEYWRTNTLRVVYRANHQRLPIGYNGYNSDFVEIDLPYTYVEPLLYYVGSRLHNPMGLVNDFNAGNNYAAKYERACAEIEKSNVRVDQDNQNMRLVRNGWV